jgi:hypothetical protein
MSTITYSAQLVTVTCWCGIVHAVPENLRGKQERDWENGKEQQGIHCPLGHVHIIAGEAPIVAERRLREKAEARAQRAADRAQAERDLREHTEQRLRAQKGATTRARKRAVAAVCPCCGRSFENVRRHMASKHPEALAEHGIAS